MRLNSPRFLLQFRLLLFVGICFTIIPFKLSSQEPTISGVIEQINQNVATGNTDQAYSSAAFIWRFYSGRVFPKDLQAVVIKAVSAQVLALQKQQNWGRLVEIFFELESAPESLQKSFSDLRRQVSTSSANFSSQFTAFKRQQSKVAFLTGKGPVAANGIDQWLAAEDRLLDLQMGQLLQKERELSEGWRFFNQQQADNEDREFLTQALKIVKDSQEKTSQAQAEGRSFGNTLLFGLVSGGLVIIGLVFFLLQAFMRQHRVQYEQYRNTLGILHATPQSALLPQPLFSDDSPPVPKPAHGPSPRIQTIMTMVARCQEYSAAIDRVSNRNNATRTIADLLYKVTVQMGQGEETAILHYAVGLVYDIGFLNIDPAIFSLEEISDQQFKTIKEHVNMGECMLFFIPEEFRPLFRDGVRFHHENLDGSGYPGGVKKAEIPLIGRLIHVVESYVALVSNRVYSQCKTQDEAFQELFAHSHLYDAEIITALKRVLNPAG